MDILNPLVEHTMDRDTEITELRRRLAASELRAAEAEARAMKAVSAEDTAQFAFETAKLRADRLETALRPVLVKQLLPILPDKLENSAEGIADCLIDDIATGTLYDELDINGHIEAWAEERRG